MINWKVRFKNPTWVITVFIPGVILLAQMVLAFFNQFIYPTGYSISDDAVVGLMGIVNFFALTFLGIGGVIDPTTWGWKDSKRALDYDEPKDDSKYL